MVCIHTWLHRKYLPLQYKSFFFGRNYNNVCQFYGSSCQASQYFGIWLKSEHFSVVERNVIPTGTNLISAFCILMVCCKSQIFGRTDLKMQWGFGSDYTGSRIIFILGPLVSTLSHQKCNPTDEYQTYGLIPNGILAAWPPSIHLKEFAFLTCGVQLMTAIFYTWANELCAGDVVERALVISSMNGMQYAVAAWLPIVIFPQTMAPTFRKLYINPLYLYIFAVQNMR